MTPKKITYLGVNLRDERTVHWKLQNVAERNQNRHQQMKRHILFMNQKVYYITKLGKARWEKGFYGKIKWFLQKRQMGF